MKADADAIRKQCNAAMDRIREYARRRTERYVKQQQAANARLLQQILEGHNGQKP